MFILQGTEQPDEIPDAGGNQGCVARVDVAAGPAAIDADRDQAFVSEIDLGPSGFVNPAIAKERRIGLQKVLIGFEVTPQIGASDLFFSFKQEFEADRKTLKQG